MNAPGLHSVWLAWRILADRPAHFAWAALGVAFAVLVMFAELGFFHAINDSSSRLARIFNCDLIVSHPDKTHLKTGAEFSDHLLRQTLDVPGVAAATPLLTAAVYWRNPQDGHRNRLLLLGVDLDLPMLAEPALAAHTAELRLPDRILFDDLSRPELGRVTRGTRARLDETTVQVAGFFSLGANFSYEGHLLASAATFRRVTGQSPEHLDLGLIRVRPGESVAAVQSRLRERFAGALIVLTPAEVLRREVAVTVSRTPTGIVFGLGLAVGFAIGVVVCYRILFTEVHEHLRQFAMLKALGHPPASLSRLVLALALILGVAGAVLGTAASAALFDHLRATVGLPLALSPGRIAVVCGATLAFCLFAGWRALAEAHAADPAELY